MNFTAFILGVWSYGTLLKDQVLPPAPMKLYFLGQSHCFIYCPNNISALSNIFDTTYILKTISFFLINGIVAVIYCGMLSSSVQVPHLWVMVGIWVQEIGLLVFMPGTCEWAGRVRGMDKKRDPFRSIPN